MTPMNHLRLGLACVMVMVGASGLRADAPQAGAAPAGAPAPVKAETMQLQVAASLSSGEVGPGQKLSMAIQVTPKKGMHVYAPGKHDYQVIAIKIDPQPWLKVQPTTYPASEIYDFKELNEKVEVYSKPFTLAQDLAVLATPDAKKALAVSSTVTVSGKLEYQACDDRVCYAPTKIPVSFSLNVKASARP